MHGFERNPEAAYIGRFAPSPTGPLHFGSIVAALASYLDARSQGGIWRLRMEDLDRPREVPGAADAILRDLEAFGLEWDGPVVYQSQRDAAYADALEHLIAAGLAYPCGCTRREIAAAGRRGPEGPVYPGTCRDGLPPGKRTRTWRARVDAGNVSFTDLSQGTISQPLAEDVGDFVLRRADHLFAYQLAVVVDDAEAGVTHIVRGADLLDSTPRQIWLQRQLGFPVPAYRHVPLALDAASRKLSKREHAPPANAIERSHLLWQALTFMEQDPPAELYAASGTELRDWAITHWRPERFIGIRRKAAPRLG